MSHPPGEPGPPVCRIATFYRFVAIEQPEKLAASLRESACAADLKGTVVLAHEGINGTLTGRSEALGRWLDGLCRDQRFAGLPIRFMNAASDNPVFHRLKVLVKDEIVALQQPGVDPTRATGEGVDAATWNRLLDDPGVTVVDTRNEYEVQVGTFPGALNPTTRSFREFPEFVRTHLDPADHPRIAMFCTGGVRCEKVSAYLLDAGFGEVYQLAGGILSYLEEAGEDSRFVGDCFVFDQRVAVNRDLEQGDYVQCHACRRALAPEDVASPYYQQGISCPHCHADLTECQRASFAERRRQVVLAGQRGELHVGASMRGASMRGASMSDASMIGATMPGAKVSDTRSNDAFESNPTAKRRIADE